MLWGIDLTTIFIIWASVLLIVCYAIAYKKYEKALAVYDPKLKEILDSTKADLVDNDYDYDDSTFNVLQFFSILPRALWPFPVWLENKNEEVKKAIKVHAKLIYLAWVWIALLGMLYLVLEYGLLR